MSRYWKSEVNILSMPILVVICVPYSSRVEIFKNTPRAAEASNKESMSEEAAEEGQFFSS
jgi:hypothetical protein